MALPLVRMETNSQFFGTALNLKTGPVTVTAGRCSVPWNAIAEAMQKGFTISDPSVMYPPAKGAMCPPAPLSPVLVAAAPVANVPQFPNGGVGTMRGSAELPGRSWVGTTTAETANFGAGDPVNTPPALGDHKLTTRGWTPPADPTPYAVVNLPDGTTMKATSPNIVVIPEQHIAYFKGLGWTLLSENM